MNKLINKYNMSVTNEIYYVAATETYKLLKFSHFIYADLFSGAKKYAATISNNEYLYVYAARYSYL